MIMIFIKKIIKKLPLFKNLLSKCEKLELELAEIKKFSPPGHFNSPIPSIEKVLKNEACIWKLTTSIPGIELNSKAQLNLIYEFEQFYNELPFSEEKDDRLRYFYSNPAYSYSDAILLYCMVRQLKPLNIIEIGSGYSSCVLLDTNELHFNNKINIHFIEPYPQHLIELIKETDTTRINIYEQELQEISLSFFQQLRPNDILFIDSTHVSKIGSDVNYLIHNILPSISDGVYIHFHDIFYPFEYPKEWILEGRAWNEQYILRAFLQYNTKFEIVLFNTYIELLFKERIKAKYPLLFKNTGGSIWIKKLDKKECGYNQEFDLNNQK